MSTVFELFKDVYVCSDPFCESHRLSYHMDLENTFLFEERVLDIYRVVIKHYGLTHGGSFESAWGPPTEVIAHSEEFREYQHSSSYEVLSSALIGKDVPHQRIRGKRTPTGAEVLVKDPASFPWIEKK